MSMSEKAFLDTSVQVQRVFGYRRNREFIAEKVRGRAQFLSRYVLMEYKRRIIRSFVLFYSCLMDEESVSEALNFFESEYSGRMKSDIIKIISMLVLDGKLQKDQALTRLERLIDWELVDYFEAEVNYIEDLIDCNVAKAEARIPISCSIYIRQLRCRKNERQCKIDNFVTENSHLFKKIGASKRIAPRLRELCSKVCNQPEESRGRNCATLGDVIISIEAAADCVVCSYDKTFEVICKEIGKDYDIFPFLGRKVKPVGPG